MRGPGASSLVGKLSVAAILGTVGLGMWVLLGDGDASARTAGADGVPASEERSEARETLVAGKEFLVVLIGGSFCQAAQIPGFPEAFESIKSLVRAQADSRSQRAAVIGVALDWDPKTGLEWLQKLGRFDEVSTGRNWLNSGAVKYIWRDLPGPTALPQIVVVQRAVEPLERTIVISDETVVLRKLGAAEIMEWAKAGAPVPH